MAKILIVDDDPDFVLLSRYVLESQGYEVVEALDGRKAMETIRRDMPDLVLLDVMMSVTLEGVQISRQLDADPELAAIPVVMVSSIGTTEYASEFPDDERVPISGWISKPIQAAVLLKTIKHLLKHGSPGKLEAGEGTGNDD
jgi:CheY-like chemotaxis protein